jgi:hypothetical protein
MFAFWLPLAFGAAGFDVDEATGGLAELVLFLFGLIVEESSLSTASFWFFAFFLKILIFFTQCFFIF